MQNEAITHTETDIEAVWGVPLTAVHCPSCGEAHLVPEEVIPQRCPLCLQGPVKPQPAYLRDEPPELVIPYRVSDRHLASTLEQWAQGIWFRPTEMDPQKMVERTRRYLIPLWLVDGEVESTWQADVGFDYQVVSSQDRYSDGVGWSSQEVKETRVRWEPRAGRLNRSYDNLPAPALDDHRALMQRIGTYDLTQQADYDPEAAADAATRIPTLPPEAAWPGAEVAFRRAAADECRLAAGADHIRDFTAEATYRKLNWTQLLLPAYVTWYEEGGKVWPVMVNGQSARVSGTRRASAKKANTTSWILGGVALILFIIGGLLALVGVVMPPVGVLGGVIFVAGLVMAVAAPVPAIGAWAFNRRSTATSSTA
jgi:hypothetical protein